jgi:dTDP-4-amino-4,6-dideoxygalactose transaminase
MQQDSMIWLSSPHSSGRENKYIAEAFNNGRLLPLGENVSGFEEDLQAYFDGNVYVSALNSGTSAIHLALILLGVSSGDEVICQSLTFTASANPIVYLGATPVFVDSEPQTWGICPTALEAAIKNRIVAGKKPKAIIAVHLYGMPYKVDEVNEISLKYNIPVVEDSAEALGSKYKGRKCGALGNVSVLSFNGNKIITTTSGGALICKNLQMKERAAFLAAQAKDPAPYYQHSQIGFNYRLSNILAGIGRGQMEVLEDRILQRRSNHEFYINMVADMPGISVFSSQDDNLFYSNYWLNVLVFEKPDANISLMNHFLANNIESRPVFKPLHLQPVFSECLYFGENVAESIFNTCLCVPSGSNLTLSQKMLIKQSVKSWYALL